MLIELFIFFEIVMIVIFLAAFFMKQEILWAMSAMLSGVLMVVSYNVEYVTYVYNSTIVGYTSTVISNSYPYLMGINMLFFFMAFALGLFDVWDKYGAGLSGNAKDPNTPENEK